MTHQSKLLVLLLALFGLTACNTTAGFGEDVEAAGEQIEETANDAKDELTDDD